MSNTKQPLKRWSNLDIEILTRNIDKILEETPDGTLLGMNTPTIKQLALHFDRTEAAVHHKARILAVKLGKIPTKSQQIAKTAGVEIEEPEVPVEQDAQPDWQDQVLSAVYGKVDYATFKQIQKQLNNRSHE
jgi:hypothetical protein